MQDEEVDDNDKEQTASLVKEWTFSLSLRLLVDYGWKRERRDSYI